MGIVCIEMTNGVPQVVAVSEGVDVFIRDITGGEAPFTNEEISDLLAANFSENLETEE